MKFESPTIEDYVDSLPEERRAAIRKLQDVIKKNLPKGFSEEISYGMIGYVVPLSIYPQGYPGNEEHPLPFMNIGSHKDNIGVYHMGMYEDLSLMNWFKERYEAEYSSKLDIRRGCLRFMKIEQIPYKLLGELSTKISVMECIEKYEASMHKARFNARGKVRARQDSDVRYYELMMQ